MQWNAGTLPFCKHPVLGLARHQDLLHVLSSGQMLHPLDQVIHIVPGLGRRGLQKV